MDESLRNITRTYQALGLWERTLTIVSTDNGGNPGEGGSNYPLRGTKGTIFEGGVRGLSFVAGAGVHNSQAGTVSHELMHVTDW